MPEDHSRVEAYLCGEPQGFAEVDAWVRSEFHSRYPRLRSEHEDLTQTVHEKLLINLRGRRFEYRSSLHSYVTAIVHRTAIDRLRELYRDRALGTSLAAEGSALVVNPYLDLEHLDERRLIRQVLLSLPAACRELWRLVFVEKLGYPRIAELLRIPMGTVKSRMWHCRRHAATALKRLRARRGVRRG